MLYVELRCHIIRVMLTGVRGNAAVEQGRAVHTTCTPEDGHIDARNM